MREYDWKLRETFILQMNYFVLVVQKNEAVTTCFEYRLWWDGVGLSSSLFRSVSISEIKEVYCEVQLYCCRIGCF